MAQPPLRVVFRLAAGPRIGYGHLLRSLHLSRALRTSFVVSLRGGRAAAVVARRLEARIDSRAPRDALTRSTDALIVDDPSPHGSDAWVRAARARGIPVVSLHDLGIAPREADVSIDGSVAPGRTMTFRGPRYVILDPRVRRLRAAVAARSPRRRRPMIVVSLGGGPRTAVAMRIARALVGRVNADLTVFLGLGRRSRRWDGASLDGVRVAGPSDAFLDTLARADVAVLGGGVTLYESAALGVVAVPLAVVRAQRSTIVGFVRAGAAAGPVRSWSVHDRGAPRRLASLVASLVGAPERRRAIARRGRLLVDGLGARRVARVVRRLIAAHRRRRGGEVTTYPPVGESHAGRERRPR